ncbi:hypothetical protein BC827DRAFT_1170374, partial [Russula dissimulans]
MTSRRCADKHVPHWIISVTKVSIHLRSVSVNTHFPLSPIVHLGGIGPSCRQVAIETLPDDILIEIFDIYVDEAKDTDEWHILVHVCRRWRNLVFASPQHLGLQLLCTNTRPTREMLAVWPPLPIIISNNSVSTSFLEGADNIIAAFEQHDRVCGINLQGVPCSLLETFAPSMQESFPVLTSLVFGSYDEW